ncbi:MAG: DNA-binding NtrC family response regulator [Pseudohongiellaceae bacterium]|jgi:adenylate cyclase
MINKQTDCSILLVEDDTFVGRSLARMLHSKKLDVSICADPVAALALCDTRKFDLIITDQRLPVMNGTELAMLVRKKQPTVRILLISGYSDRELVAKAIDNGAVDRFFSKPWDNAEILSIVEEELSKTENLM